MTEEVNAYNENRGKVGKDIKPVFDDIGFVEAFEAQLRKLIMSHQMGLGMNDRLFAKRAYSGRFWQDARIRLGLSRRQVAERMGELNHHTLIFLENGMVDPDDFPASFLDRLGEALDDPSLVDRYRAVFEEVDFVWHDLVLDEESEAEGQEYVLAAEALIRNAAGQES